MANTVHKDFEPLSLKMHKHTEKVKEAASVSIHKQSFKVKKKEILNRKNAITVLVWL